MTTLRLLVRTWRFLFDQEQHAATVVAGAFLTSLYPALATWLSGQVVDRIRLDNRELFFEVIPGAVVLALCYGVASLLNGCCSSYVAMQLVSLRDRTRWRVDALIMKRASRDSDVMSFELARTRDRINRASMGGAMAASCVIGSVEVAQYLVTAVVLSGIVARYNPWLVLLVALPSMPLFYSQMRARSRHFSMAILHGPQYRRMQYCVEVVLGARPAKELRAYECGSLFISKYKRISAEVLEANRAQRHGDTMEQLLWGSVAAVGSGIAYLYVIIQAGSGTITVGELAMYGMATMYLGTSMRSLIYGGTAVLGWVKYVETFFDYIDSSHVMPHHQVKPGLALRPSESSGTDWVIRDVSFKYPGREDYAIENVSCDIRRGETVALVGLNGAGKSTLMKLMLGLLKPDSGRIEFRGRDIQDWDLKQLRSLCGAVFQESARFRRLTLYENIALAARGELEEERRVFEAARLSGVDEVAASFPAGYDTQLGREFAGGIELSGGQWQRVALARGIARQAEVVFLDEPSASLDSKTEQEVLDRFLTLVRGRTALIISHRLSITSAVDRILVLESGRLIEHGRHLDLMRLGGRYAAMYNKQARMYGESASTIGERPSVLAKSTFGPARRHGCTEDPQPKSDAAS